MSPVEILLICILIGIVILIHYVREIDIFFKSFAVAYFIEEDLTEEDENETVQ